MWKNNLSLRVAGPTVLVSLLLLSLCVIVAVNLYGQQNKSVVELGENVSSVAAAHDLENTLHNLISLLREGNEQPGPLHKTIERQLVQIRFFADKDEEKKLI